MTERDEAENRDQAIHDEPASARKTGAQQPDHQSDAWPAVHRPRNVHASVAARLLKVAHERDEEYQLVLMHYGIERLLYRLGRSTYAGQFVVKGAMLFTVWAAEPEQARPLARPHRATHDLDLLGYGSPELERLKQVFRGLCQLPTDEDDGLVFQAETLRAAPIREEQEYGGIRLRLRALLGKARIPLQVDVGFGDVVTPGPTQVAFPTLLPSLPAPQVRIYSRETVVAEKFEAIIRLGLLNTRMKDFYDLWTFATQFTFKGDRLCAALLATFARRGTKLPKADDEPIAFTARFGDNNIKRAQWTGFLRKGHLATESRPGLPEVLIELRRFLLVPTVAIAQGMPFHDHWRPGGPWTHQSDSEDGDVGG